jgi:purine-nucleoside phosphorylase
MQYYDAVHAAAEAVRARIGEVPSIAIVLGSGLGDFAGSLASNVSMPYGELPNWPVSSVVGHEGRLVVGLSRGTRIAALAGRSHLYEGHDPRTVTFAVRVLGLLGVNTAFAQGALMVMDDHLNLTGQNPLVGLNDDRFGPRFPDMSRVYSAHLRRMADESARAMGLALAHGVYAALLGPSYETPAEIRYLRTIGADAVGMSTALEAIAARHMGIEVLGLSCITNMAAGVLPQPLDHAEVMETARRVRGQFIALVEGIIDRLA